MIPFSPAFFGDQTYPEAQQYLDRMASTDADLRTHLRTLIEGIVDDGNWTLLDKLTVAQLGEPDSLLNLVSTSFPSTNAAACPFTADQGFTTSYSATDYIKSGFIEAGTTQLSESDATLFVYRRTGVELGVMLGAYDSTPTPDWLYDSGSAPEISAWLQTFSGVEVAHTSGFQAASRPDASTTHACSKRVTGTSTNSATGKTPPYYEYYLGTYNNQGSLDGSASSWSDGQYSAHGCGAGMTPSQLLKLEARLQTYFTSRGTAV